MNIPIWVIVVIALIAAYLIYYSVVVTKERDKYDNESKNLRSDLGRVTKEKETCEKELANSKAEVEALNKLLGDEMEKSNNLSTQLRILTSESESLRISELHDTQKIAEEVISLQKTLSGYYALPEMRTSDTKATLTLKINRLNSITKELLQSMAIYKTFFEKAKSNLTLFPYMAGIVAEYETRDIEELAKKLDWGRNYERAKKVASIRSIRHDAQEKIEQAKEAEYQLAYLLQMFPSLQELLEYDYAELPKITADDLSERDNSRDYLSKEEWDSLSVTERNQLALDRYIASKQKSKWQIGRDYEEYVGYYYRRKGYAVDNYGAYMGLEDLGRDVIATKDGKTLIIQCKYWSQKKEIHENHINQLFGTVTSYIIEKNASPNDVVGLLITNTQLSAVAKKFADRLKIQYIEHFELGNFPRIKCNIGHSEWGTFIYHLPFDQQYDATKISEPGEFYAMTVAEAEAAGFRRAFKWHGH